MMDELRQTAIQWLEQGEAEMVIGYGEGSGGRVRPVFIRSAEQAEQLIFDERCTANLAVYLKRPEIRNLGKPAIVANAPAMRTLLRLSLENQLADLEIRILGVPDPSVFISFTEMEELNRYLAEHPLRFDSSCREKIHMLDEMSMEEKWEYWSSEFSECLKCYACRAACPLCYCDRCTVDCNQPQWVSVPAHPMGNLEWHLMRAMHLAGRCVDCGACFEACPVDIPLNLLTQKLHMDMEKAFVSGKEEKTKTYPLNTFRPDDKEDFFL